MKKEKTTSFIFTVGRRKRSIARVRLFRGKGQSLVNDLPLEEYFKPVPVARLLKPFHLTKTEGKYYVTAKITGGGKSGQAGAFIHGLSRALVKEDSSSFRAALKSAGLLTRDPREKERRKFGLAQSARAKKQSPKR